MVFAVPLLLSFVAALQVGTRTADRAWAASADGPPFVLEWRQGADGTRTLEVIPRWADGGAITLALMDGESATPRTTASFAVQAQRSFAWEPPDDHAGTGPMRVTASWRDPAGRAGGTATALWPAPPVAAAPLFTSMPPVRLYGLHLDQAINLP